MQREASRPHKSLQLYQLNSTSLISEPTQLQIALTELHLILRLTGVRDFTAFAGVERPEEMRQVTRAHRNRLAKGPGAPGPGAQLHPQKARRGRLFIRPPLRGERGQPQPRARGQTPQSVE